MTTTQELLESAFELNLNNYGPEDVERLNDWAIKAYAALETLQAEHTDEVMRGLMLEKAHAMGLAERDAALARLAEIENQEPAYLLTPDGKCYAYGSAQPLSAGHADATLLKLYAAAGASPVEPSQAQPPAPSDTAITYMTGYSDGREWAKPSQALVVEPVYQYQLANGNWIDQTKESYDYNVKHGQATVRMLYATPQPKAAPQPKEPATCTPPKIIDPDAPHPCFN